MSVRGDGEVHGNRPCAPACPEDIRLADAMSDYWIAFAKTGKPAATGRPQWQPYGLNRRHYMHFGSRIESAIDLLPGMLDLYSAINEARDAADLPRYLGNIGLSAPILPT